MVPDYLTEEERKTGVSNFLQTSKRTPLVCPKCGKKATPIGGAKITVCPFCGTDFPQAK